ncbi:kynurenine 3-monooxygenase, mitochondrial precursor (Biosynthesis of nicotinic acid protein 4) [Coniochaeta pulveracea]|uniref:Kynurenine 3-monooxygenase n=1 Tax=Coniochaeta pulveracea TaxID=177199 RepID=A0A420Y071_9PEZI|nr:kynurenine 3-monooxygenase, mitochondrial precursor (Biosynthesis of nicotinic acid protein 4) [Coniochaeta pulveracea]
MGEKKKVLVVGAGPVGSLAALYAAQRGDDVEIYELRNDLRDPTTTPLNFTKSINLALSERGINAMRRAGRQDLLDHVMSATIPMRGRMIHGRRPNGDHYEEPQDYDVHGRTIFAVDRGGLNKRLLDILERMPNVKFYFNHKLTGADFRKCKAWFEIQGRGASTESRAMEVEVDFDFMIGADGAHSAVRYHMMKYARMDYQQEYIDTLWCEFQIKPKDGAKSDKPMEKFAISPNHLHIWPGKEFMFIAIPSDDGSFTCTLFAPSAVFGQLELSPSIIPSFFNDRFPGVTALIQPQDLISQFLQNPHLPLINIKCKPYHYAASVVILGDAAHAMVPFYGQGMNAGLEDVRILFEILDKYERIQQAEANDSHGSTSALRATALAEYSAVRVLDAHAINDLALQNYIEMRSSVLSPTYRLRKFLEEFLSVYFPGLGWQTKYARVSFGNEPYSTVVAKSDYQSKMLIPDRCAHYFLSPCALGRTTNGPDAKETIVLEPAGH